MWNIKNHFKGTKKLARARHNKFHQIGDSEKNSISFFPSSHSHIHNVCVCAVCLPQTLLLFTFKFHFSIAYTTLPHCLFWDSTQLRSFFCVCRSCTFYVYIFLSFALLLVVLSRAIVALFLYFPSFFVVAFRRIFSAFSCKILTNSRCVERKKAIRLKLLVKSHCVSAIIERKWCFGCRTRRICLEAADKNSTTFIIWIILFTN